MTDKHIIIGVVLIGLFGIALLALFGPSDDLGKPLENSFYEICLIEKNQANSKRSLVYEGRTIFVGNTSLDGADIRGFSVLRRGALQITFTEESVPKVRAFTSANINREVAMIMDNQVVFTSPINTVITSTAEVEFNQYKKSEEIYNRLTGAR